MARARRRGGVAAGHRGGRDSGLEREQGRGGPTWLGSAAIGRLERCEAEEGGRGCGRRRRRTAAAGRAHGGGRPGARGGKVRLRTCEEWARRVRAGGAARRAWLGSGPEGRITAAMVEVTAARRREGGGAKHRAKRGGVRR